MNPNWPPGPAAPDLGTGEIHIWSAFLNPAQAEVKRLSAVLSPDERARADRFHFERHRRRYIVGRGVLRELLGRILDQSPEALKFAYSEYDKPSLATEEVRFNLAHTDDLALYAFCRTADVGVDVERVRELEDAPAIAARFFSPAESVEFQAVEPADQMAAFFRCWTRKEAFIKAVGEGLSYPLDDFVVSFAQGQPARLLSIRGRAEDAALWSLVHLSPAQDFTGALAVKALGLLISRWHY